MLRDATVNSLFFHLLPFLQPRAVFPEYNYNGKWCDLLILEEKKYIRCFESIAQRFYQALVEGDWRMLKNLRSFRVAEFAAGTDSREFR